jgi:VIT1/CCC1 family predicted Fe2+/Mn2+ transporter
MKPYTSLTALSLLGALLFTAHVSHDLIFGIDRMTRTGTLIYLMIMVTWLYGTLELPARRSGNVIMLLAGLLGAAMPVLHDAGAPRSIAHGYPFVWTMLALGAVGALSALIAARELVAGFRAQR